jgi:putative transposase
MRSRYPRIPLERITGLFGKSRQGYYDRIRSEKDEEEVRKKIVVLVKGIRKLMPKLGGRKMHYKLQEEFKHYGIKVGRDRLFDILREEGLLVQKRRRGKRTTNSNHWLRKYSNLIKDMAIDAPNQVWVSDITYIDTEEGFNYLSLITDAYSKKILGQHLSRTLEAEGCLTALRKALKTHRKKEGIIHHSDRGIQYCSKNYIDTLINNGMWPSMTDDGNVYENAIAERINGILKEEFGIGEGFKDYYEANKYINQSINIYNNERPHLSCGMLTPEQAHNSEGPLKILWKNYPHKRFNNIINLE